MQRNDFEAIYRASFVFINFYKFFSKFSKFENFLDNTKEWLEQEKYNFTCDLNKLKEVKSSLTKELLVPLENLYERFYENPKVLKDVVYKWGTIVDINNDYFTSNEYEKSLCEIADNIDEIIEKCNLNVNNIKNMHLVVEATAAEQLSHISDTIRCLTYTDFKKDDPFIFQNRVNNLEFRNIEMFAELNLEKFRQLVKNKDGNVIVLTNPDLTSQFLGCNQPHIQEKFKNIKGDVSPNGVIYINISKVPSEYFRRTDKRRETKKEEPKDSKKTESTQKEAKEKKEKVKKEKRKKKSSSKISLKGFFKRLWHYITLPFISIYSSLKKLFKKTSFDSISNIFTFKNLLIIIPVIYMIGHYFLSKTNFIDVIVEFFNTPGDWINDYDMEIVGLVTKWVKGTNYNFFTAITLGLIHIVSYVVAFILDLIVYLLIIIAIIISFILTFIVLLALVYLLPIACVGFLGYKVVISFKDDETNTILSILGFIVSVVLALLIFNLI